MKIRLLNLNNNWDQTALTEFEDFDPKDKAKLKEVNEININVQALDTKQQIVDKLAVSLFELLVTHDKNWKSKERCRYCFQSTVEVDEGFIECSTCNRLYTYQHHLNGIPFPKPEYFFFRKDPLTRNTSDFQDPLEFLDKSGLRWDRLSNLNTYFDRVADQLKHDQNILIDSLLHQKPTEQIVDCIYFPDFYEFIEKTEILQTVKQGYTKLFWPNVNYKQFQLQTKNSKTLDRPNFTKDNNVFVQLSRNIKERESMEDNYQALTPEVFDKINKSFNSVVLKSNLDKEPFMNLLYIFQTIQMNETMPYVSYYVEPLDKLKAKVWRPLSGSDLHQKWSRNIKHVNSLRFKVKVHDIYYTLKLYDTNEISISLPRINNISVNKQYLEDIIESVNQVIRKIQRLPYQQKLTTETLQTFETDLNKWGHDDRLIFAALNMNNVIEAKEIDMIIAGRLLDCLKNYVIVDIKDEHKVSFFYIYDVEDKQGIRYERFLRKAIKLRLTRFSNDAIENLKVLDDIKDDFRNAFNLDEQHANFVFNAWIKNNESVLNGLKEAFNTKRIQWSLIHGIYVTLEYMDNNIFRFNIHGIKYWRQENDIIMFIRRLFHLIRNLKRYPFFKNICKVSNVKQNKTKSKEVNLKRALKKHLPDLFWDPSPENVKGYARKCQKKEQPLIFTTEEAYLNWLEAQQPKNKNKLQKIFTRKCPYHTTDNIVARIKELNHKPVKGRDELCLQFQQVEFQNKDRLDRVGNAWTDQELKQIVESLNLPVINTREKLVKKIERYFAIEEFKIKENVEDIMPNPHTFVVEQDANKFYITCPNNLDNPKSKSTRFIGFLDVDDHPSAKKAEGNAKRKFCVPCCRERISESRVDFCTNLIDYDEYTSGLTTLAHIDYIKNQDKFPLPAGRYGHVPDRLYNLLNQHPDKPNKLLKRVSRLALIKKGGLYMRYGIPRSNFSFIMAVSTAARFNENMSIRKVMKRMRAVLTDDLFRSLNNGNLAMKYNNNLKQYKAILDHDNLEEIDIHDVWDLLSRPNVLDIGGLNIFIFEMRKITQESEELHLICPQDQEIDHFFVPGAPAIFIYKQDDIYEPIITYFSPNLQVSRYAFHLDNLISIASWYKETCSLKGLNKELTAKSLSKKYNIKLQLVDAFNKVQFVLTTDDFLLPTVPSGMVLAIPHAPSSTVKKYTKTFNDTMEYLKEKQFTPKSVVVRDDFIRDIVVHDRLVPVIPEKYKDQLPINKNSLDLEQVDNAILRDLPKQSFKVVRQQTFREEAYQRYRFEFSHFIGKKDIKKIGVELKRFRKELDLVDSIDTKVYERQNMRLLCTKSREDQHCNENKLIILKKDIDKFEAKLTDEIERFPLKRQEILEKRVNILIDPLVFLNDRNNVYT